MKKGTSQTRRGKIVIVAVMVTTALLHFVTGSDYGGPFPLFVNGYMIDILLPFAFYLLLCLSDNALLNSWIVKGLLIFSAAAAVELAQYNGLPLLGRTFDPWDIFMYGLGVLLAILCDMVLFPRIFSFWEPSQYVSQPKADKSDGNFVWRQD